MITTIESLSNPAPREWIQGEVAKTMVHYFVGQIPPNFAKSIGADFDHELAPFPAWAIVKARRWWLSSENDHRHRKPLPGDLSKRCKLEMAVVNVARSRVELFDRTGSPLYSHEVGQPDNPALTPEARAARSEQLTELTRELGAKKRPPAPQSEVKTQENINAEKDELDRQT